MKICYLAIDSLVSPGVAKKIISKVNAISGNGVDVKCCLFSESGFNDKSVQINKNFELVKLEKIEIPVYFHRKFIYRFQKLYYYNRLFKQIFNHLNKEEFDFIVFRYPGAHLGLLKLVFKSKAKFLFEFNSIALEEILLSNQTFLKNYYIWSEKYVLPFILFFSKGIIGVTDELRDYYSGKSLKKIFSVTITNAIDTKNQVKVRESLFDGININIVVVVGSGVTEWYGVDRLFYSLKEYKGKYNYKIFLVGGHYKSEVELADELNLNDAVVFKGHMSLEEIDSLYNDMHVGMSALALYRKKLNEACTLKVREYGLKGLPIFCAYKEVDFDKDPDLKKHILEFPNDNSLIDLDKLGRFVAKFYESQENASNLSAFIKSEFSYDHKAKELIDFIDKLK